MSERHESWYAALNQGGLFLDPDRLPEGIAGAAPPLSSWAAERLQRELNRFEPGGDIAPLLDTVLEGVLRLGVPGVDGAGSWLKASAVPAEFSRRSITGEAVRPRRLWRGRSGARLPVFTDEEPRLGVGRGKRQQARVLEWLRADALPLALLANGRQWRLLYAGAEHEAWLECELGDGRYGPQLDALRLLLSPKTLTPEREGAPPPLLQAVLDTRKGQTRLSGELGERVREAVELLVREVLRGNDLPDAERPKAYQAAVRAVMRLVVILFAEARGLLPRDNAIYHESYGLQSLRAELERQGADEARLKERHAAWPRLLALFRLVHDGCAHEQMPVHRYGGKLFASSEPYDDLFGNPANGPSDHAVREILRCLTRARDSRPVDFSGLSTEYIGILYEGLLDYELHRAPADDAVLFLNLGDQPALPLRRLEELAEDRNALAALVEKAGKRKTLAVGSDDEEEAGEEGGTLEEEEEEETPSEAETPAAAATAASHDAHAAAQKRAAAWARHAVVAGGLVEKPRSRRPEVLRAYEEAVAARAESLIFKTYLPSEWYLVRFGGTRKGAGTFYTKPELARPTVERTLKPLCHAEDGAPRKPEEILSLKVCDPACGSGSFLVAAVRYLTDALYRSLVHHGRIQRADGRTMLKLAEGTPGGEALEAVAVKLPPDHPDFEETTRAQLKRYIVEGCIYGVDLDALAVELCRVALWIETMDRDLPFSFLDHKIKLGNSLVGCWFDQFRDYPVLAWEREGGDKNHGNGVHYRREEWTRAIKRFRNERVKPGLADWIRRHKQHGLFDRVEGFSPETIHDHGLAELQEMHRVDIHEPERQADLYARMEADAARKRLKEAFDAWCALWFWPADRLAAAPLPADFASPRPETLDLVRALHERHRFFHWELEFPDVFNASRHGFDAVVGNPPWENLQAHPAEFFSAVDPLFRGYGRLDSLAAMKQQFAALPGREREWLDYCAVFKAYANWSRNAGRPFGDGNDGGEVFSFGRGSADIHRLWRERRVHRSGYADQEHPFRHLGGGRIFTYKLFLEQAYALLQPAGRLGFLVPSAIYTDKGSTGLRHLFLERCRWEWLFSFENRDGIFEIDSRFKFCPVVLRKGAATEEVQAAFMHRDPADWSEAERHVIPYRKAQIQRFSPRTRAFLEIRSKRDLEILEKIYANSVLLGDQSDDGWKLKYALEFMMNTDAHLFPPRPQWEAKGYRPDEYSRWLLGPWRPRAGSADAPPDAPRHTLAPGILLSRDGQHFLHESEIQPDPESGQPGVALPLYEGRMIGQFDFSQKGWVHGKGRGAVWREIPFEYKQVEPQYLMLQGVAEDRLQGDFGRPKLGFMDIASATNARTMYSCLLSRVPNGHSAPVFRLEDGDRSASCALLAALNSLAFDYGLRLRIGGLHLTWHYLEEVAAPCRARLQQASVELLALGLAAPSPMFAPEWHYLGGQGRTRAPWRRQWAVSTAERLRLASMLDAIVSLIVGLDWNELAWILRDCDLPRGAVAGGHSRPLDPKGFWRMDQERNPELRHPVLALVAFADLLDSVKSAGDMKRGLGAFLSQNGGEGWMLPETLRLADLGPGHDDRARHPQPVRERLGERCFPWQLQQGVEESWRECELHARNLLGEAGFRRLQAERRGEVVAFPALRHGHSVAAEMPAGASDHADDRASQRSAPGVQAELFQSRKERTQ